MRCPDIETGIDKRKASYQYTWKKDNDENSTVKTGVITSKRKLECAEAAPGELYVIYYTSNDIKKAPFKKHLLTAGAKFDKENWTISTYTFPFEKCSLYDGAKLQSDIRNNSIDNLLKIIVLDEAEVASIRKIVHPKTDGDDDRMI